MTDVELRVDLQRQFEESGDVPFSIEEGALIAKLSFTTRSLTKETFREAWTGFLAEIASTFRHCTLVRGPRDASSRSGRF
jgi:hypothetical protein